MIDRRYPLEDVVEATRYVETGAEDRQRRADRWGQLAKMGSCRALTVARTSRAVLRPDGVGAQHPDTASRVPEHRDGRRGGPRSRPIAALVWVNVHASSYDSFWETTLSIDLGRLRHLARPARLGQQRPDDVLLLRRRARGAARVRPRRAAGTSAVRAPGPRGDRRHGGGRRDLPGVQRHGRSSAIGMGGRDVDRYRVRARLLALVGPRFPDRLRAFMLTVVVVDDIVALIVIATVYTESLDVVPLLIAIALFAVMLVARRLPLRPGPHLRGARRGDLGRAAGVRRRAGRGRARDGAAGLRLPAPRSSLERVTERFREFREQPTAALAQRARAELRSATSVNERLQQAFHPWTSYVIVPVFALGERRDPDRPRLARARVHVADHARRPGRLRRRQAGRHPRRLVAPDEAQPRPASARPSAGRPSREAGRSRASASPWRCSSRRSPSTGRSSRRRSSGSSARGWRRGAHVAPLPRDGAAPVADGVRGLLGTAESLVDLYIDVDPERDHIRGPVDAPVTVVEYGDFECPFCGRAEPVVRELLSEFGDVRYVWRHLPLSDVHANAQTAAEARRPPPTRGRSGRCTTSCSRTRTRSRRATSSPLRRGAGARRRALRRPTWCRTRARARRRRRRQRRPERRLRHADVLRQRTPPPRRLRHRHALERGARRGRAGARVDAELNDGGRPRGGRPLR